MSIDFARAKLLMDVIVEAGKHGPMYQIIAGAAGEELKQMMKKETGYDPKPGAVTPAAGPADGLVRDKDGNLIQRQTDVPQQQGVANPPRPRTEQEIEDERRQAQTRPLSDREIADNNRMAARNNPSTTESVVVGDAERRV